MYWLDGPPVEAMLDTSGIGDSLPLTSLALDTALLQWGLFDSALSKIGLYFDTFIYPNGETPPPARLLLGKFRSCFACPAQVQSTWVTVK